MLLTQSIKINQILDSDEVDRRSRFSHGLILLLLIGVSDN